MMALSELLMLNIFSELNLHPEWNTSAQNIYDIIQQCDLLSQRQTSTKQKGGFILSLALKQQYVCIWKDCGDHSS